MSPAVVDAEKQDTQRRPPSTLRCAVLTCATVAFVSLCVCVVFYERDALSPSRFANVVVVVDYPDEDGRRPSPSVRVEMGAFDAPGPSARRHDDDTSPSFLMADDKDDKDTNAISSSVDKEKFDAAYDVAPPVAKRDNVEKFGMLLQTLMSRPGVGFDDVLPHVDNVDVVLFMSDPANGQQSGEFPIAKASINDHRISQSVGSPIDIFNSLVRGQQVGGMERHGADAWSSLLQQRMGNMEMFLGAADGEEQRFESLLPMPVEHMLAVQHMMAKQHVCPEHNMLPEQHVLPDQGMLPDQHMLPEPFLRALHMLPEVRRLPEPVLRALHMLPEQQIVPEQELLPEQNMLPEQQIFPEQPVVEVVIAEMENPAFEVVSTETEKPAVEVVSTETEKPAVEVVSTETEQPVVEVVSTETEKTAVEVVSTESTPVNKLLIAIPVMQVKYEEITVSSPHSSSEGSEQVYEDKPLPGQIDPESVENDNSSRLVSTDDAEQSNVNESSSVSSPEVEMQSVQVEDDKDDQIVMPAVRADYKIDASNGGAEVNVAMTGAVPVPKITFRNFWQDIMEIFSSNARPISTQ